MKGIPDIQSLFPDGVAAECRRITDEALVLYPEERESIKKAIPKRRQEFAVGRACARRALERLGCKECVLPRRADRQVQWPSGVTGTISHSHTWCGAAVARSEQVRGVGLDIETLERMSLGIERKVLTARERDRLNGMPQQEHLKMLALIFSAKEAFYKCMFPLYGRRIGFMDAIVLPDDEKMTLSFEIQPRILSGLPAFDVLSGRYLLHDGNVFTAVVII